MSASEARMIDVGGKPITERRATSKGFIRLAPETLRMIREGTIPKGDVLATARVAGIMAAKHTPDIVPLCHPIPLSHAEVALTLDEDGVAISATASATARTGVEMETLAAVSAAALTIYDMCKAVDPAAVIENIRLVEKSGGKSGHVRLEGSHP